MKTPEQMAEEWSRTPRQNQDVEEYQLSWDFVCEWEKESFLAGYQAAKLEWISVHKRLPEYDQLALLWQSELQAQFVGRRRESGVMSPLYYWECTSDFFEAWKEIYHPKLMNEDAVTHWMPLPKPPEE